MSKGFKDIVLKMAEVTPEPEDYTGEDGLLYCGKCHTPRQFRMDKPPFEGRLFPRLCQCEQEQRDREKANQTARRHLDTVDALKRRGFTDPAMRGWTFENDNGKCQQMKHARFYVEHWEDLRAENIGYLLWGDVGTGKSYFAGCIANALMEKEIPVRMTNFAMILGDLTASFEGRNEYINRLCRFPLLIIDDFGMERGTEYALEQVYNVVDSRYRSGLPLIVTTNLSLMEIQHPQDTSHARIYDRLLAMCVPVCFTEENFRRATAQGKLERLKTMMELGTPKSAGPVEMSGCADERIHCGLWPGNERICRERRPLYRWEPFRAGCVQSYACRAYIHHWKSICE